MVVFFFFLVDQVVLVKENVQDSIDTASMDTRLQNSNIVNAQSANDASQGANHGATAMTAKSTNHVGKVTTNVARQYLAPASRVNKLGKSCSNSIPVEKASHDRKGLHSFRGNTMSTSIETHPLF